MNLSNSETSTNQAAASHRLSAFRWAVLPFIALYLAGYFFPETWWGTHFVSFLPLVLTQIFGLIALYLFFLFEPPGKTFTSGAAWLSVDSRRSMFLILAISVLCAVVYFGLSMETDIYGDARRNLAYVTERSGPFDPGWLRGLLSPNVLDRETGESLVLNLVLIVRWGFEVDGATAFGIVNAAFGFIFALAWSLFVNWHIRRVTLKLVMVVAGVTSGVVAIFTDHSEVYAAGTVFLLLYLIANIQCFATNDRRWVWALPLFLFLAVKSFFGNHILWVPFLLTIAYLLFHRRSWFPRRLSRGWFFVAVLAPILVAFSLYYVFVIENHNVGRFIAEGARHQVMFLPVINGEPTGVPPYTIFSPSHIVDFANVLFLWSTPALFLVIAIWFAFGRKRLQSSPALLVSETVLFLYVFVFFVTNPLLTMPRDWDLFSVAAPALLVYSLLLVARIQNEPNLVRRISGPILALAFLNFPIFIVNNNREFLTHRLESIGIRAFKTYRYGSVYIINVAAMMVEEDPHELLRRRLNILDKVRPHKLENDDHMYADLAYRVAELYLERSDYPLAKQYFLESYAAKPGDPLIKFSLAQAHYSLGEYDESLRYSTELAGSLGDQPTVREIAFLAAYAAGKMEDALEHGERYLSLRPDDNVIQEMLDSVKVAIDRRQ
jgi:hypothetical protein